MTQLIASKDLQDLRAELLSAQVDAAGLHVLQALLRLELKFRLDQPRDDRGRWVDESGGASGTEDAASDLIQQIRFRPRPGPGTGNSPGAGELVTGAIVAFFAWLSAQNSSDRITTLTFNAQEYRPSTRSDLPPLHVGVLTREQVDAACPRHAEVQERTSRIAREVRADGVSRSPAAYGTEVHARLAAEINGPRGYDDPVNVNFRAEVSILKSNLDDYGTRGSVRVDVLERVDTNTVCVYDIKTGRARLSRPRIDEIAFNVNRLYPGTSRLLIIETRPR